MKRVISVLIYSMFVIASYSQENSYILSEHFTLTGFSVSENTCKAIIESLEGEYYRISRNLRIQYQNRITIEVYKSITDFHEAIDYPNGPDWLIGYAGSGKIQIVNPDNPGGVHTRQSVLKAAVHEMTHLFIKSIVSIKLPVWVSEGIASYESCNIYPIKEVIHYDVTRGEIPSFNELSPSNFVEKNGYEYSSTIIEYIVYKHGYDYLLMLLNNIQNQNNAFDITKLENEWKDFLKGNY